MLEQFFIRHYIKMLQIIPSTGACQEGFLGFHEPLLKLCSKASVLHAADWLANTNPEQITLAIAIVDVYSPSPLSKITPIWPTYNNCQAKSRYSNRIASCNT